MLFAWAKDEGGLRDCVINNAIADTANVFAFPFILIFNELGILNSLTSGIIGLLFNSSLYAFILERSLYLIRKEV